MRQIDIESRFAYNKELLREAEHYRLVKQTLMNKPQRVRTIYIPIAPRTFTRKLYKSFVVWLASLFPDLACYYNWVPCEN
jgi:hypothetical protein